MSGEQKPSLKKTTRSPVDWEAIEREYRAGQLSVREIARQRDLTEGAIRKRAKLEEWTRPLADKVRKAVREKLVRADGTREGTQEQRASDAEIVANAATRGFEVQLSHRRDLAQLYGLKCILADRLSAHLRGAPPDGPGLGDKESPGDLLEKLSRVTSRLIPLERQAFNLDERGATLGIFDVSKLDDETLSRLAELRAKLTVAGGDPSGD